MIEQSLVILKPDALERQLVGRIISRLEDTGLRIVAADVRVPTEELLITHYPDSLAPIIGQKSMGAGTDVGGDPVAYGKMVLRWNRGYMMRGPVLAMVVEGYMAIERIRALVGSTDPPKSVPGTIRFDLGVDCIKRANDEARGTENLLHASGSPAEADVEIELWFPKLTR